MRNKANKTETPKAVVMQRVLEGQQLREQLHDLVDRICLYAEEPANWPITQQEQIAFVRFARRQQLASLQNTTP